MNNVISFTPAELAAFIGALFAFIASIGAGVAVIAKLITKIRKPELEQNRRIEALEKANKEREEEIKLLNIERIKAVLRYRLFTYFNIRLSKFSYIVHLK